MRSWYRPFGDVLLRTTLLPVGQRHDPDLLQLALLSASPSLAAEAARVAETGRTDRRFETSMHRYLTRLSTRPTPYGLLAGVALAGWGAHTDLWVAGAVDRTRTRIDMGCLLGFIRRLEARGSIRSRLRLRTNPLVIIRAGRAFLAAEESEDSSGWVKATRIVRHALLLAERPIACHRLVRRVRDRWPAVSRAQVDAEIAGLLALGVLESDLRPPLTGPESPAEYLLERLARIPAAETEHRSLKAFVRDAGAIDAMIARSEFATAVPALRALHERGVALAGRSPEAPRSQAVQIDLATKIAGESVSREVGAAAATAAELLLRLSGSPFGPADVLAMRRAFIAKYGAHEHVPLLVAADPERGLGNATLPAEPPARPARRERRLLALAARALRDNGQPVELADDDLEELSLWAPTADGVPATLDLAIAIAASTRADIDAGRFRLVVAPNVGVPAAGRHVSRFGDLLGRRAIALLHECDRCQEAGESPGLRAELVYLPSRPRGANVMIRPAIRPIEIVSGVQPSATARALSLAELEIGIDHGRFAVYLARTGERVVLHEGHMLNHYGAPPACRLLGRIAGDGIARLEPFDWGPASELPFLPRVQRGNVVLRTAEWRIADGGFPKGSRASSRDPGSLDALSQWRREWAVPRHVLLGDGDQRLMLDLDDPSDAAELTSAVAATADARRPAVVHEALPGPESAWLGCDGGHYMAELIVALARRDLAPGEAAQGNGRTSRSSAHRRRARTITHRNSAGTDRLGITLSCSPRDQEQLLAGAWPAFRADAHARRLFARCFFERRAEPESQLRFCFHGTPATLVTRLLPELCAWARGLTGPARPVATYSVDECLREMRRYGGAAAAGVADRVFAIESVSAEWLLARLHAGASPEGERLGVAALSCDRLLDSLGIGPDVRRAWYHAQVPAHHHARAEFQDHKVLLRELLGASVARWPIPAAPALHELLVRRGLALSPLGRRLRRLHAAGALERPLADVLREYVRAHVMRLCGPAEAFELTILALLARTADSLALAPVRAH